MRSHNDLQWPESGPVSCPDWSPEPVCGQGLHGLLWGCGKGALLDWSADAKWLVVEVLAADIVALDGGEKIKFPRGVVVYAGDRKTATETIAERRPGAIVGITATAGARGTATAGDDGILNIRWYDGKRYRIATMYVGEDGIEPNVPYKVGDGGRPVRAEVVK